MYIPTVQWKEPSADLHRKSPRIFLLCLFCSIIFTLNLLYIPYTQQANITKKIQAPPVIITLQNIPQTRLTIPTPAPPKPFIPNSQPIEVDEDILPDKITIEKTTLDFDQYPPSPPTQFLPEIGSSHEEQEIFEYYAVEEQPQRINAPAPMYPEMAERAGIQGTVNLKVLVNQKGYVDSVVVINGPTVFHSASVDAARATTFTPARQNDRPVACWVVMPFRFVLKE